MDWIAPLNTLEPLEIAQGVLKHFPQYVLGRKEQVPKRFGHPKYFGEGGAWALYQFHREGGECQAIARLARGMMRQVGVPGIYDVRRVWGDPVPKHEKIGIPGRYYACMDVRDNDLLTGAQDGLNKSREEHNERQVAWWVDKPVSEGDTSPDARGMLLPLNRYEACLRFTKLEYKGRHIETLYLPAGASGDNAEKHTTKLPGPTRPEDVLHVFTALIWLANVVHEGQKVQIVRDIHWRGSQYDNHCLKLNECDRLDRCEYHKKESQKYQNKGKSSHQ